MLEPPAAPESPDAAGLEDFEDAGEPGAAASPPSSFEPGAAASPPSTVSFEPGASSPRTHARQSHGSISTSFHHVCDRAVHLEHDLEHELAHAAHVAADGVKKTALAGRRLVKHVSSYKLFADSIEDEASLTKFTKQLQQDPTHTRSKKTRTMTEDQARRRDGHVSVSSPRRRRPRTRRVVRAAAPPSDGSLPNPPPALQFVDAAPASTPSNPRR